jgi:hypothetical protein
MLERLQQNIQPVGAQGLATKYSLSNLMIAYMPLIAMFALIVACMYPDSALAVNNLEQQLDKVGAVANGKFKTIGLTSATIGGGIWSVVKGNLKLAGIIIVIGITLSLYLEWIAGGMVISA